MMFVSIDTEIVKSMTEFFYSKNYKFEDIDSPNCLKILA